MTQRKYIVIVDYGLGNLYSLAKAVSSSGANPVVSEDPEEVRKADALFLPGVGAFPAGMDGLTRRGLIEPIKEHAKANKPLLGICLGMQLMMNESEEFGIHRGLGIIPGRVIPFTHLGKEYKIPHIGWNQIKPKKNGEWTDPLLKDIPKGTYTYFVHSFYPVCSHGNNIVAETTYSATVFSSIARHGIAYGMQFHPEKSGEWGLKLIKNFIDIV